MIHPLYAIEQTVRRWGVVASEFLGEVSLYVFPLSVAEPASPPLSVPWILCESGANLPAALSPHHPELSLAIRVYRSHEDGVNGLWISFPRGPVTSPGASALQEATFSVLWVTC